MEHYDFIPVSGFPVWASVIICGVTASIYTALVGISIAMMFYNSHH